MSEETTSTSSPSVKKIPLVEMFGPTIQGEGAVIGQQTYFMRFGLCDYKCKMCDSMNAVDPLQVKLNAKWLTQLDIYNEFMAFHKEGSTRWITLSGGNPCIHDLTELVLNLNDTGFKFAVETQGTFAPDWLKYCRIVTCSPKGPGRPRVRQDDV
jgi:7-carboxy-7-deazaguanine synthase